MGKYTYVRHDILDKAEVEGMINRAPRLWIKAAIAILYLTGARVGEVLRLKKSDFTINPDKITIRLYTEKKRGGPIVEPHRRISIPTNAPFVVHILRYLDAIRDPDALLFPLGSTLESSRRLMFRAIKRLNPLSSPHLFRHTRMTKLAMKGADEIALVEWAGWADGRPAWKYLHTAGKKAEQLSPALVE